MSVNFSESWPILAKAQSFGRKLISSEDGTRPSVSFGKTSVLSMALSTDSSQARTPLDLSNFLAMIVPSGEVRTSTTAVGLPAMSYVKTMLGLTRAATLPP